jgi:hypothetical protein
MRQKSLPHSSIIAAVLPLRGRLIWLLVSGEFETNCAQELARRQCPPVVARAIAMTIAMEGRAASARSALCYMSDAQIINSFAGPELCAEPAWLFASS